MNILIAPDSFKESLPAVKVCLSLKRGLERVLEDADIRLLPMADGGEGTIDSVTGATSGSLVSTRALDPLMREVETSYGITGDGTCAVIEMAAVSGLGLLEPSERDPEVTSTFGTGQLMRHALDMGVKKIILGIGGSATNDAGTGMAAALGARFTDAKGKELGPGGGELGRLAAIHLEGMDRRIKHTEIVAACDVTNPLTGPDGASLTFGPQKGASPELAKRLDRNLGHLARAVKEQTGLDLSRMEGGGAAGGLGAGLVAFTGASLVRGFGLIADLVGLEQEIQRSDLVITGEGRIDGQTLRGKTPMGVATLAKTCGKPLIMVAGWVEEEADRFYDMGASLILSIQEKPMQIEEAIKNAEKLLERSGEKIARIVKMIR